MTMRIRHLFLAALVAASGHAVAQLAVDRQEAFVAKNPVAIQRGSLVVLLPLQPAHVWLTEPLPASASARSEERAVAQAVARGEQLLLQELARQLKAAGLRVSALDTASFNTLLAAADEARGAAPTLSRSAAANMRLRVLPVLAQEICAQAGCVAVIEPRIVSRFMTLDRRFADWDGVQRRLPWSGRGGVMGLWGRTPGLSVALLGLAANGQVMFRSYGGAAVPFATDGATETAQLRTDLFTDTRELAEGVEVALRPLLAAVVR